MEEDLKELLEAKQKAQEGSYESKDYQSMMDEQQRTLKNSMPKMPSTFKIPSTNFKMPKMPNIKI